MLAILRQVLVKPLNIIGILCMLVLILFHKSTSMYYYLTIAQLVYVPIMLQQITPLTLWQKLFITAGQFAVTVLYFVDHELLALICASMYLLSTIAISFTGVKRFLHRGFTNPAELMIDIGLLYITMGGVWFFAHVTGINTGFSSIITWLTAIHFHYSAFLLCITVGLLGRLHMSRYYAICASIIAAVPILVAISITFSRIVEIMSVSLYVVAIFSLCGYTFTIQLLRSVGVFIRLAFCTLCFTIIWSFLYAYSNLTGSGLVDIPDMLNFHGVLNCILFGGAVTIAWSLFIPETKQRNFSFPLSNMRGSVTGKLEPHHALVDDMNHFIDKSSIPPRIIDFYENTYNYELQASVLWATWFKPFALVYQLISRRIGQLNLPFTSKHITMNGTITHIDCQLDGRPAPRVWQRTANGQTIFSAIYAMHEDEHRTYMNIALPLPKSCMHGILTMTTAGDQLYLTSDDIGDAGTYLSIGQYVLKLPLHEYFTLTDNEGQLQATHDMTLFGINFLHITYWIEENV